MRLAARSHQTSGANVAAVATARCHPISATQTNACTSCEPQVLALLFHSLCKHLLLSLAACTLLPVCCPPRPRQRCCSYASRHVLIICSAVFRTWAAFSAAAVRCACGATCSHETACAALPGGKLSNPPATRPFAVANGQSTVLCECALHSHACIFQDFKCSTYCTH